MADDEQDERIRLAALIADGAPVDWTTVAATTSARSPQDEKILDGLRSIAAIARAHGTVPATEDDVHASIRAECGPGTSADPVRWGPLRVFEKIGRGSFGDVYRARDPRLDRDVALKLLRRRSHVPDEAEIVEEARLMARVRHPNVVTIYGAERIDGRTGIWMELLSQGTLADEVASSGPMPGTAALQTLNDLASALSAIHGAGLLHRDVKPQNVLRNERGLAVLTDFGTGHPHDEALGSPIAGTPLYVAPEILAGHPASGRADIYSLGVLLYFLLSGRHPVEGHSLDAIREAHLAGRRTSLASRGGGISRRVATLVDRATDPDPSVRPATAAEFQREIAALLHPSSHRGLAAALILGVLVSTAAYGTWRATSVQSQENRALVRAGYSTTTGLRTGGVSPDGSNIVCGGPKVPIALCGLRDNSTTAIPLAGSPGIPDGGFAQFSPDGRRIVYSRQHAAPPGTKPPWSLHIANIDGTDDRRLFAPQPHQWFLRPAGWAAGTNLIVGDLMDLDGAHRIVLLDPHDPAIRVLREFDRGHPVETLAISTDGRFVVHDYQAGNDWTRDLVVIDVATKQSWTLVGGDSDEIAPIWDRDGSRVFFSSDRSGTLGIWTQRVAEGRPVGEPELLIDTGRDMYSPSGIARDGRILYTRRTGGFDGYRTTLDLSGGAMSARRLSPRALDQIAAPDWSADGSRLAYLASAARIGNRTAATKVAIQDVTSGREFDWVIDGQVHQVSLRWFPDGKSLLLRRPGEPYGRPSVEQRQVETGRILREFSIKQVSGDVVPTPDASALVYMAGGILRELRLTDMQERQLIAPEKPWSVSGAAGISMARDGDLIAVSAIQPDAKPPDAAALVVSRRTGAVTLVRFPEPAYAVGWTHSNQLLAVTMQPGSDRRVQLFAFDPVSGARRDLGLTAVQPRQFRLHPDGRQLVFSAGESHLELWWLKVSR